MTKKWMCGGPSGAGAVGRGAGTAAGERIVEKTAGDRASAREGV